jgi:chaperonin GroEL (HSP60 family)
VLLAAQLLKEVRSYIEEGVSPHIIMKGFRKASQMVRVISFYVSRFFTGLSRLWNG